MRRRLFLHSSSAAAVAFALTGCGGGGGGSSAASGSDLPVSVETTTDAAAAAAGAATAQPQSSPGTGYPFGARIDSYVAGIRPSQSNAAMDSLLTQQYDAWKARRVVSADSVVSGGYAVKFSGTDFMAVSEGMGYGMLLTVLFAGHDGQAQDLFNGMLAVVRARSAYGMAAYDPTAKFLMDWRLNANGTSGGDGWNAMDGDLDIAMALLMAHRQWGSAGKWNYLEEGKATINAIASCNMHPDGTTKGLRGPNDNRTSDYMIGHFRAFKAATGDKLWDKAVDKAYKLLRRMQAEYSPSAGLIPDFVQNANGENSQPSPGYIGDGNDKEGFYWWNACRNPWRFSSDYLLSGDARFAEITGKMIDFFNRDSGGDPVNIGTGYALDGTKLTGGTSPAYHGPICAGACVDGRFQGFLDAMWDWNAKNLTTGYYDSELQLLSMVVASGNWWTTA